MTADLDTLSGGLYSRGGEVLPDPEHPAGGAGRVADQAVDRLARSRELFEQQLGWLEGREAAGLEHGELEARLGLDARTLFCQLCQDHLDVRSVRERPIERGVLGSDGTRRGCVERGHQRLLGSVFGSVSVNRIAYRAKAHSDRCPADGALNLPAERHSHGLRRGCAIEAGRGSYDDAVGAVQRLTGQRLGKRQAQALAQSAAVDFEAFYRQRAQLAVQPEDVLALCCDGKGVVMLPDALRESTRRHAANSTPKLAARLSKGEKRHRKRMAEVGAVHDAAAVPRAAADVLPGDDAERAAAIAGPVAKAKWVTASVVDDAATVVGQIFDQAERRDPEHQRPWVALVDGNQHQINRIQAEAKARQVTVNIVCDFVPVIEYLWSAAWSFHNEGDPAAETWVHQHAREVLHGNATKVAGKIRRAATTRRLTPAQRNNADTCATYLTNKPRLLDYPTALAAGWPIATGVIEGACRHLVKERMDITGARWGLTGAEAILKLRAIITNGDFNTYWRYHLTQERQRVHQSRYANAVIPQAA